MPENFRLHSYSIIFFHRSKTYFLNPKKLTWCLYMGTIFALKCSDWVDLFNHLSPPHPPIITWLSVVLYLPYKKGSHFLLFPTCLLLTSFL